MWQYDATRFAESFQTTIAEFGHIDIVINNAGIMNDRFWELEVDINLVSKISSKYPLYCTLHVSIKRCINKWLFGTLMQIYGILYKYLLISPLSFYICTIYFELIGEWLNSIELSHGIYFWLNKRFIKKIDVISKNKIFNLRRNILKTVKVYSDMKFVRDCLIDIFLRFLPFLFFFLISVGKHYDCLESTLMNPYDFTTYITPHSLINVRELNDLIFIAIYAR